jgi:GTP-binding protein
VAYKGDYLDRRFTLVDTGGWEPDAKGIDASVAAQAEVAIDLSDVVLFVVDATVGRPSTDEHVVRLLRKTKKPVFLVANKVDDPRQEPEAAALWNLGLGEPYPVSALHGRGVADMLEAVFEVLPQVSAGREGRVRRPAPRRDPRAPERRQVEPAQQGRRRGARRGERARRHDPRPRRRADRARRQDLAVRGHRRHPSSRAPAAGRRLLRVAAHQAALEKAEVAVVLLDVSQPISEQDVRHHRPRARVGARALVLAYNKWDLLDDDRRRYLEREIDQDLHHVAWAPRVNISARTGRHLEKLVPALETALESWDTRIPTGKFNAFLTELTQEHPHPVRGGKQPPHPVRHAGREPPAHIRALHDRIPRTRATAGSSSDACARSTDSRVRPS